MQTVCKPTYSDSRKASTYNALQQTGTGLRIQWGNPCRFNSCLSHLLYSGMLLSAPEPLKKGSGAYQDHKNHKRGSCS